MTRPVPGGNSLPVRGPAFLPSPTPSPTAPRGKDGYLILMIRFSPTLDLLIFLGGDRR